MKEFPLICSLGIFVLVSSTAARADVRYVSASAAGNSSGTSWTNAFPKIADALAVSSAVDQVWVAAGTYAGPITLKDGVSVIGGFAGTESAVAQADPITHRTSLTGANTTRVLAGTDLGPTTIIRGFHIVEGYVDVPEVGAGVQLENSNAAFVDCIFTNNHSKLLGGAVAVLGGSPTFVNCRFTGNQARGAGGAVFSHHDATPTFVNCLFDRNTAGEAGAVSVMTGAGTFTNCTLTENEATILNGGGLYDLAGKSTVRNSILWNNRSASAGSAEIFNHPEIARPSTLTHTTISGGWAGEQNGSNDPKFVAPESGDYRLSSDSPCRDAGENDYLPADTLDVSANGNMTETLPLDLSRAARVSGTAVDRGAFEWRQ